MLLAHSCIFSWIPWITQAVISVSVKANYNCCVLKLGAEFLSFICFHMRPANKVRCHHNNKKCKYHRCLKPLTLLICFRCTSGRYRTQGKLLINLKHLVPYIYNNINCQIWVSQYTLSVLGRGGIGGKCPFHASSQRFLSWKKWLLQCVFTMLPPPLQLRWLPTFAR